MPDKQVVPRITGSGGVTNGMGKARHYENTLDNWFASRLDARGDVQPGSE